MISTVASFVVLLSACYLIVLASVAVAFPVKAKAFLGGFASTRSLHYLELAMRLLAGGALVIRSPLMAASSLIEVIGWVLIITTCVMLLVPWKWHQQFAAWSVPQATKRLPLLAVGSVTGGILLLLALQFGPTP